MAWVLSPHAGVDLEYGRPAKGAGYFALSYIGPGIESVLVASADRYDERHGAWFRSLVQALGEATGATVHEIDRGPDA